MHKKVGNREGNNTGYTHEENKVAGNKRYNFCQAGAEYFANAYLLLALFGGKGN